MGERQGKSEVQASVCNVVRGLHQVEPDGPTNLVTCPEHHPCISFPHVEEHRRVDLHATRVIMIVANQAEMDGEQFPRGQHDKRPRSREYSVPVPIRALGVA